MFELCVHRRISTINKFLSSKGVDVDKMWTDIDDTIIKTLISAHSVLKHNYRTCFPNHVKGSACFEILGFDVLLDKRLRPYVIEVNHSPSFSTDAQLDREIKGTLIWDTLGLINFGAIDRRRCLEEERRRIKDRLLGKNIKKETKEELEVAQQQYLEQLERYEDTHLGNFRRIFPVPGGEKYDKYFHSSGTLFQETAAFRARSEMARQQREEILRKKEKMEQMLKKGKRGEGGVRPESPTTRRKRPSWHRNPTSHFRPRLTQHSHHYEDRNYSEEALDTRVPMDIQEEEELERISGLLQRDNLVRGLGIVEHVYRLLHCTPGTVGIVKPDPKPQPLPLHIQRSYTSVKVRPKDKLYYKKLLDRYFGTNHALAQDGGTTSEISNSTNSTTTTNLRLDLPESNRTWNAAASVSGGGGGGDGGGGGGGRMMRVSMQQFPQVRLSHGCHSHPPHAHASAHNGASSSSAQLSFRSQRHSTYSDLELDLEVEGTSYTTTNTTTTTSGGSNCLPTQAPPPPLLTAHSLPHPHPNQPPQHCDCHYHRHCYYSHLHSAVNPVPLSLNCQSINNNNHHHHHNNVYAPPACLLPPGHSKATTTTAAAEAHSHSHSRSHSRPPVLSLTTNPNPPPPLSPSTISLVSDPYPVPRGQREGEEEEEVVGGGGGRRREKSVRSDHHHHQRRGSDVPALSAPGSSSSYSSSSSHQYRGRLGSSSTLSKSFSSLLPPRRSSSSSSSSRFAVHAPPSSSLLSNSSLSSQAFPSTSFRIPSSTLPFTSSSSSLLLPPSSSAGVGSTSQSVVSVCAPQPAGSGGSGSQRWPMKSKSLGNLNERTIPAYQRNKLSRKPLAGGGVGARGGVVVQESDLRSMTGLMETEAERNRLLARNGYAYHQAPYAANPHPGGYSSGYQSDWRSDSSTPARTRVLSAHRQRDGDGGGGGGGGLTRFIAQHPSHGLSVVSAPAPVVQRPDVVSPNNNHPLSRSNNSNPPPPVHVTGTGLDMVSSTRSTKSQRIRGASNNLRLRQIEMRENHAFVFS
ncbi:hypothetical protein ACOMHN_012313 [Nucella lapillus]